MRLMVVDDDGVATEVVDDLEDWDLQESSLTRAALGQEIADTLRRLDAAKGAPERAEGMGC